jgi:acetyl-CoA carboxylase carboxyltransferase component
MSNKGKMSQLVELRQQARQGGGEKRIAAQHPKGKLTAPCGTSSWHGRKAS